MGKVDENIITKGARGKYNDDLVFRRVDKKTNFFFFEESPASETLAKPTHLP